MFRHTFELEYAPQDVLAAHRDGLVDFGPGLPGVASVERTETQLEGPRTRLSHRWSADLGAVPAVLMRVVPPEHFAWYDHATWDEETGTGTWAISVGVLGEGPHLRGRHAFRPTESGCEVTVEAEMLFTAGAETELLGIRLGRLVSGMLQRFIHGMFERVVTHSGVVIGRHLDQSGRRVASAA